MRRKIYCNHMHSSTSDFFFAITYLVSTAPRQQSLNETELLMMISHGTLICEISFNGRMVKFNNLIDRKLLNSTNQFHRDIVSLRFNHEGKTIFLTLLKKMRLFWSILLPNSVQLSSALPSNHRRRSSRQWRRKRKKKCNQSLSVPAMDMCKSFSISSHLLALAVLARQREETNDHE